MKLTISIGTYNRPEFIQRQVRDVLNQLQQETQLVVFDNCSDIPVASLFNDEELSRFTIIRNKVNIGRDQNQVRSIEYVDEGWVWTLSDDDKIKPDAVMKALSLIDSHRDCCYINCSNKKEQFINSFEELTQYFRIIGSFGISFFQSECLYNVDVIKKSIFWFNDFLSSQIGQICMVIKHMELNVDSKCFITTESLTCDVQPGGWDPAKFIMNSSILLDKFNYKKKDLRNNLFMALANLQLTIITDRKVSRINKCSLFIYIIKRHGLVNLLKYNLLLFLGCICNFVIPEKLFLKIRKIISELYNKRVDKN